MMNQFGVVLGIQVMQTVQAARASSVGEVAAYGDAYLVGGAVAFLGVIAALFVARRPSAVVADEVAPRLGQQQLQAAGR
jgi:hypothetical protein